MQEWILFAATLPAHILTYAFLQSSFSLQGDLLVHLMHQLYCFLPLLPLASSLQAHTCIFAALIHLTAG
jgi:hypothetical protein